MVSDLIFYASISGILFYIFYRWALAHERYFYQRSMKHFTPKLLLGNTIGLFLKLYTPTDFLDSIYYRFPKEKWVTFVFCFIVKWFFFVVVRSETSRSVWNVTKVTWYLLWNTQHLFTSRLFGIANYILEMIAFQKMFFYSVVFKIHSMNWRKIFLANFFVVFNRLFCVTSKR